MSQPVAPTAADRLLSAFRSLTKAQFPQFDYAGTFEYSVQSATSSTVDCSPTDTTLPLPSLTGLPMRSGLLGESVTLTVGKRCLVQFINRDPTRPIVVGADPIPVQSTVDASATLALGPSSAAVNIAGGANPLIPSPWATDPVNGLVAALGAMAAAMSALPPSPFAPIALIGDHLTTALGVLPSAATTKTKAT